MKKDDVDIFILVTAIIIVVIGCKNTFKVIGYFFLKMCTSIVLQGTSIVSKIYTNYTTKKGTSSLS